MDSCDPRYIIPCDPLSGKIAIVLLIRGASIITRAKTERRLIFKSWCAVRVTTAFHPEEYGRANIN